MNLPLDNNLLVTQSDIRLHVNLANMIDFVKSGGFWTLEAINKHNSRGNAPIIQISRFEDGINYIHDGHHRCIATILGGRNHLTPEEYCVTRWKYIDYLELNPENKWFTPFDPRTELRYGDFNQYKKKAKAQAACMEPADLLQWVLVHRASYCKPRQLNNIRDLVKHVMGGLV